MYAGPHSEHVNTFTIGGGPLTHMPDSPRSGNGLDCLPDATNSRSTGHLFVSVVVVQRVKHQLTGFKLLELGAATLWIIGHLFVHNELARGLLVVDGRQVNLSAVDCPSFLLAGIKDHITPPEQVWALADLVATPRAHIARPGRWRAPRSVHGPRRPVRALDADCRTSADVL